MNLLYYKKVHPYADNLDYAKPGDAGLDLAIQSEVVLLPEEKRMIGTGIAVRIPNNHFGMLVPRSSCGKLGIGLANTVGIIDSQYTGEIILYIKNLNSTALKLGPKQRIAQLIVVPFAQCHINMVDELEDTERGDGGFGHTG